MTMYRMRQREMVLALIDGTRRAAPRAARSRGAAHRGRLSRAHPYAAGAADDDRALPDGGRRAAGARHRQAARGLCEHQPESARRVRDHRYRLSHRSLPDDGAARLRWLDRQHLRQHRHGRLPARERLGRDRAARGAGARCPGSAAVVHDRGRLPAPVGRIRPVQQHHAAEAQSRLRSSTPGRSPARRSGRQRPSCSPSTTRPSATSSTRKTICSRSSRRCSATASEPYVSSPPR